ncbi:MAG: methyltransferase domain-containing protein [Lentimicrobium sp.]|jgi:ubiquinone/menaquinone biosynthesis C-methylase UbiE|nr:methyltransferase domain-containing protein [Lentimicrobium sp.]
MDLLSSQIENFYSPPDLYDDIIHWLKERGVNLNKVSRKDIAGVDEFHVRGAEVSRELAEIANISSSRLLDIGCGIGGPCRMLADEFDCDAIGIDLSPEYVETANRLSALVGLSHNTKFIQGNATNLPFQDNIFDAVWTQHLQMNIRDKLQFYNEITRVLNNNGVFIYYEVFKKGDGEVNYPMPWADKSKISFLEESSQMNTILEQLGLIKQQSTDQTEPGIKILERLIIRILKYGVPKFGLNVLMGVSTQDKISNLLSGLKEGKIHLESGIYKRTKIIAQNRQS